MSPAASQQDVDLHLVRAQLLQRMRDGAQRARHVRLEDHPQLLGLAGLDLAVEVLEGGAAGSARGGGLLDLAGLDHRAGDLLVRDDAQHVTGLGRVGQPEDDDGGRGSGLRCSLAAGGLERLDLAEGVAGHDDVAHAQRAGLHDDGGDRAAALVQARLDDGPDGGTLGVGLELQQIGDQQDDLEELVEPDAGLRRHRDERRVAAVVLDHDARLGKLVLHAVRVGVRLVDLVHRDDERHLGRLRVADGLQRLGHHAVVRRHDDHRDVGDLRPAGTHRGERLVTRGVQEDDALAVLRGDLGRADVLGDAAPLAGRHGGRPDRVEEARLAVVDVSHDGHDRGPRDQVLVVRVLFPELDLLGLGRRPAALFLGVRGGRVDLRHLVAELLGHERRGVTIDQLVDGREDAALDQLADDVRRADDEELGELLDGDRGRQLDRATL